MPKKILSPRNLEFFLVVILLFSSSFAVRPVQAQDGTPGKFQLVAGCDNDLVASQAIYTSVTSALAQSRPNNAQRLWRVYSICQKGSQGYAYVKSYSPANEPLPAPSDVALVVLTNESWRTVLPEAGIEYNRLLATMPGLLSPEAAQKLLQQPLADGKLLRYSGYALPWPAGQTAVTHQHWYPAIDFSVQSSNTIRNAKGGTVLFVKDSSTRLCGDPPPDWECWQWANTIVIQSGPNEYVWYMHFAAHTIPDWIQEGVYVPAGTDLGQQGSTGWASGPHVHFMVASTYGCCIGAGNSRLPDWPYVTTYAVDFIEYTWDQIPWRATSQNGQISLPASPTSPTTISFPSDPSPTTTQSGCPSPYIIQPGEWLYRIASKCGVAVAELIAANPSVNPDSVFPGQQLNMPGGARPESPKILASPVSTGSCSGTHTVIGGENLFRIGYNCEFSTEQMAKTNGIAYPYNIYPGQVLHYP